MSAPVSVIIPTLDVADRLGPCLGALGAAALSGVIREVIIADGGSTDGIAGVAEAVGARLVTSDAGRGTQLAAGAAAARGCWLLVLHADSILSEGWDRAVLDHIAGHGAEAGYFGLRFNDNGVGARMVAGWANLRARLFALPYGDQGLLMPVVLYRDAGGYPDWPLMEDVALVRRIGRARLRRLPGSITTSAERYRRDGWLRRGVRNLSTLALYFLGVAPERLAGRYQRGR